MKFVVIVILAVFGCTTFWYGHQLQSEVLMSLGAMFFLPIIFHIARFLLRR